MNNIRLFGRAIRANKASAEMGGGMGPGTQKEIGANLFIGNMSASTNEKTLRDLFQKFGVVLSTKVMRDSDSG